MEESYKKLHTQFLLCYNGSGDKMNNPYPYSNDNKRYQTINYYFRNKYHQKVAKIPLNAGFTCPNRDGSKGTGGCTFCSSMGSGDSILCFNDTLQKQYHEGLRRMQNKWPNCIGFAYFQSYSNTYAPLEVLKKIYDPFFQNPDIPGVAIATRADCLSDEIIEYLNSQDKEVWMKKQWIDAIVNIQHKLYLNG